MIEIVISYYEEHEELLLYDAEPFPKPKSDSKILDNGPRGFKQSRLRRGRRYAPT